MTVTANPGIYIIRCKVNGAAYVGASKRARQRLQGQLNSLSRGDNSCELLQADWNCYGPSAFEIRVLQVSLAELDWLEKVVIRHIKSLEEHGGYNKALGKLRSLAARIRDTEMKLRRKGKFVLLPTVSQYARIAEPLASTFQQKSGRLIDETTAAEEAVAFNVEATESLLKAFDTVAMDGLTRARGRTTH